MIIDKIRQFIILIYSQISNLLCVWINDKCITPFKDMLKQALNKFLNGNLEIEQSEPSEMWKKDILNDFQNWLKDLPEDIPLSKDHNYESGDLYTLLSEFIALKQEIKIQNREQHKTIKSLETLYDNYQQTLETFNDKIIALAHFEAQVRTVTEEKTLIPFFDIRDSLNRGLRASKAVAQQKSFFRARPQGIDEIIEGYEITIRRFDLTLAQFEIFPIPTKGYPFVSEQMKAIGMEQNTDQKPGIVLEEHVGGFRRKDKILRFAEVIVNQ